MNADPCGSGSTALIKSHVEIFVCECLAVLVEACGRPFSPRKQRRQFALASVFILLLCVYGTRVIAMGLFEMLKHR